MSLKVFSLCNDFQLAKKLLVQEKIIVVNTETVLGFIGIVNKKVIEKLYLLKNRDYKKPFTLFFSDFSILKDYVYIDDILLTKLKFFWPGQLTIIFKAKVDIFSNKKLAFRMPKGRCLLNLIKEFKILLSTSANLSNKLPCVNIQCLKRQFKDKNLNIFIQDIKSSNKPSTIIDLSSGKLKLVREGNIDVNKLKEVFF